VIKPLRRNARVIRKKQVIQEKKKKHGRSKKKNEVHSWIERWGGYPELFVVGENGNDDGDSPAKKGVQNNISPFSKTYHHGEKGRDIARNQKKGIENLNTIETLPTRSVVHWTQSHKGGEKVIRGGEN